jgi:site-specific DNA recombinase
MQQATRKLEFSEMDQRKRAVGYVRVSTKGQIEGTSLVEQKRRIRALCESKDYAFERFYTDEGVSGAVKERPALLQMLADAKARVFDVLVVLSIDRLARNLRNFLETFEQLKEWDIGLVLVTQPIDTESALGDFTIKLLSLLAEFQRKELRTLTKGGRVSSFRDGKSFPGTTPYGYIWDRKAKKIKIDKIRSKIYKRIVDWYLNDHLSTTSIAEQLTHMEAETPGSRRYKGRKSYRWSDDMVRRMLHNTAYYGEAVYLKNGYEIAISADGNPYHKKVRKQNDSDPVTIKFPPLITRAQWDDIQLRMEYNKRKPKKLRKKDAVGKFLTSNTLGKHFLCGLCGSKIRARTYYNKRNGKTMYQYGCTRHLMSNRQLGFRNKESCPLPAVNADSVDFEVWGDVITVLSSPRKFLREWIQPDKQESVEKEIVGLQNKLKKKQNELDKITDFIAKESVPRVVESYQKKQRELSTEIDRISADIGIKQRKRKVSVESLNYMKKLIEETERTVSRMEKIAAGRRPGDVENEVIPSIYAKLENVKSYDVKKEVLEAVVSPEQGGVVNLSYDYDEKSHSIDLDAKLNYVRTARIIKALKESTLTDGSFLIPDYLKQKR